MDSLHEGKTASFFNYIQPFKKVTLGNSLVGQWLGLGYSIAGGPSSIPGWATNIQQAASQKKKKNHLKKKSNQFCQLGHFCSFF